MVDNSSSKGTIPNRPKRTPLNRQKVLAAEPRKGFVRRLVNENFGRVQAFLDAGWTLCHKNQNNSDNRVQDASSLDSADRRVVNRGRDASTNTGVLMEIPEEFYKEDYAEKQKENDRIEEMLDPTKTKMAGIDYGEMKKTFN